MKSSVVWWLNIVSIGRTTIRPAFTAARRSTRNTREALRLVVELLVRRRAREQQQQVGVLRAGDEDLLAVDDVAVAAPVAVVLMRVVSEPASGSVTPNACRRSSPLARRGR